MREHFAKQIEDVKHKVLRMGAMVENIISISVDALKNQDLELAKKVYAEDDRIDEIELEIEKECMSLLALQQPLAKDLRTIATVLKIITDLERMGDHAVNISKITLEIGKDKLIKPLIDIPKMAVMCQEMVRMSLDAFVKENVSLAEEAAGKDQQVDDIYEEIVKELLHIISEDSLNINQGTKLLFVGRFLERIADHATNICERLIYMVTGELKKIN